MYAPIAVVEADFVITWWVGTSACGARLRRRRPHTRCICIQPVPGQATREFFSTIHRRHGRKAFFTQRAPRELRPKERCGKPLHNSV